MEPPTIQRVLMIKGGGCKRDGWVISDRQVIDSVDFITLTRRDPGFSRFVSGVVNGIRDMTFLDTFRRLRTQASLELASPNQPEEVLFEAAASKNRKAQRAKRTEVQELMDKGEANKTVPVELPSIDLEDGTHIPGITVTCKTCINIQENVTVELSTEMLTYVKHAMEHSLQPQSRKRSSSCDTVGLYWRAQKSSYLATRKENDKVHYKTFKCSKDCTDVEKAEIREKAMRWVNGMSDDEEPEQETAPHDDEVDVDAHQEDDEDPHEEGGQAEADQKVDGDDSGTTVDSA